VITALHRNRPEAATCRFIRPWNRPVPGVLDVGRWQDFEDIVSTMAARSRPEPG
jgi:hypothetical protein